MISFTTDVLIPETKIREIERTITNDVMTSTLLYDFPSADMDLIRLAIEKAFALLIKPPVLNTDWDLPEKTVLEIANSLRSGKRIFAIKEFRTITGAGLKEAKDIIQQFSLDNIGGDLFIQTFIKNKEI